MAILIDPPLWPAHGTLWSHLISDTSYSELHAFAARLAIPRRGFDLDHYDVPASHYDKAVDLGAEPATAHEVIRRLRSSGLRVRTADRAQTRPMRRREYLVEHWASLGKQVNQTGDSTQWERLGDDLIARWNEPHRTYHDERHLEDILLALNQLAQRGEAVPPETLLAAWFHDAIYEGNTTDETESARLASQELGKLGLDAGLIRQVHEFIELTSPARTVNSPTPALATLLDADLWIFASSSARYAEYSAAVRKEYLHVPLSDFITGRTEILRGYLRRTRLYFTDTASVLWQDQAQQNLAAEIRTLPHLVD